MLTRVHVEQKVVLWSSIFCSLYLSLASFWRQLTQHLLLWILILDIDYMTRVEALKRFGQPYISSVLLSYSITCSFQFTMWTVWASLQRFTCSNTCLSVCEGLSQYSHAEGTRGCANTTRVITSVQTDLHLPVKFHLTSRWFPRLVYAAERFSMCQFHACADFNHYTLCYSCVNHLIQHIKAFRVLLVKYASLHLSPSLCSMLPPPLIHGHSCPSENPSAAQREMTMLIRSVCSCVC